MTLPNMRSPRLETWNASLLRFADNDRVINETGELFEKLETEPQSAFMFVELLCNCWFLAELSVRFLVHPNKVCNQVARVTLYERTQCASRVQVTRKHTHVHSVSCRHVHVHVHAQAEFVRGTSNVMDVLAVFGFFVSFVCACLPFEDLEVDRYTEGLRAMCILRLFKLTRHNSGLKILIHTFRASMKELSLLIFFLLIGTTSSSSFSCCRCRCRPAESSSSHSIACAQVL